MSSKTNKNIQENTPIYIGVIITEGDIILKIASPFFIIVSNTRKDRGQDYLSGVLVIIQNLKFKP